MSFQPQFRGSTGFGSEHEEAGYGQWGYLIQDDITDGVNWLIKEGVADKNRICIYGASFGGYAAAVGAAKTPDLYRCAIGYVGVYSLPMKFEKGDSTETEAGRKWVKKIIGEDMEEIKTRSPAHNADKIKVPVYLIHGEDDIRVPVAHHYVMRDALKKHNKVFKEMIKEQEGHGFTKPANRYEAYYEMLNFFDEHTKPRS